MHHILLPITGILTVLNLFVIWHLQYVYRNAYIVSLLFACNFNYKNTKILAINHYRHTIVIYVHYRYNYYNFRSVIVNYWYYHIIQYSQCIYSYRVDLRYKHCTYSWTLYTDSLRVAIELLNQQRWR